MSPDDLRKAIDAAIQKRYRDARCIVARSPADVHEADAACRRASELRDVLHDIVTSLVGMLPADEPDPSTIPEHDAYVPAGEPSTEG